MKSSGSRPLPIAAILALACSLVATGVRSDGPTPSAAADSLSGIWTRDGDPGSVITISSYGAGEYVIESPGKFRAVGLTRGVELIAVVRSPEPVDGSLSPSTSLGMLRIGDATERPLHVSFAERPGGEYARAETWSLNDRFGGRVFLTMKSGSGTAPGSPASASADSLPKLGDYVYVEELPEAIERVPPDYPKWARKKGVEGTVVVQALVGKDGRVKDVHLAYSVPDLDDYAIACVKQWRFKPAKSKGKPVVVWVAIPIKFTLK
jgi:TonB family protein